MAKNGPDWLDEDDLFDDDEGDVFEEDDAPRRSHRAKNPAKVAAISPRRKAKSHQTMTETARTTVKRNSHWPLDSLPVRNGPANRRS